MAYNFLDENGLLYFWQKIKSIFAKQSDLATTNGNVSTLQTTVSGLVAAGAEANVIDAINVNNVPLPVSNKTVNVPVPTNNTELTNGAGYQTASDVASAISGKANAATTLAGYGITDAYTKTQTDAEIASAVAGITGISFEVVQTLPATGTPGTIYLVPNPQRANSYTEYIYVNNTWENLGSTDVDLSGYVQSSDLVAITNAEIDTIIAS